MNVFILNTGRCGSTTIIKACSHMSNFTSAHESRRAMVGEARFDYPRNHIEADNRLSWLLGRLDRRFGDDAVYVHLRRNDTDTAASFVRRYDRGIIRAYREAILMGLSSESPAMGVALDYVDTVNSNIELFLRNKTRKMDFRLENAESDFRRLWHTIGAKGDIDAALAEFRVQHNASDPRDDAPRPHISFAERVRRRLARALKG